MMSGFRQRKAKRPQNSGLVCAPDSQSFGLSSFVTPQNQRPTLQDIFGSEDGKQIVEYPRIRSTEPSVKCPMGHTIFLSRIPWQAGCRWCPENLRRDSKPETTRGVKRDIMDQTLQDLYDEEKAKLRQSKTQKKTDKWLRGKA